MSNSYNYEGYRIYQRTEQNRMSQGH